MIIGKSLTALGGGGLKPEITVTAKAGALLNLHYKDSSIILQSYQLGADETQHTFVVSVSETAYVVEDVTNSASVEVLVDAVARYVVEIMYGLYLIRDGYVPNGINLVRTNHAYNGNLPSVSLSPFISTVSGAGTVQYTLSFSKIPSEYNHIKSTIYSGSGDLMFGVGYGEFNTDGQFSRVRADSLNADSILNVDISNKNNLTQVWFSFGGHTVGTSGSISVRSIWLE